jgi:hypothetical protein
MAELPSSSVRSQIVLWLCLYEAYLWKKLVFLSPFSIHVSLLRSLQVASSCASISFFLRVSSCRRFKSSAAKICDGLLWNRVAICSSTNTRSTFIACCFFNCHFITTCFKCLNFSISRRIAKGFDQSSISAQVFLTSELKPRSPIHEQLNLKGAAVSRGGPSIERQIGW